MYLRFFVLLSCFCCFLSLHAIDPLDNGAHIVVYSDGIIDPLLKVAESEVSKELKAQKIKITHRKKKGLTSALALESLEKDVLKKKPQLVLLSIGLADIFDLKKDKLLENADIEASINNSELLISKITDAGIKVVWVTPGLFGEFPDKLSEENSALDSLVAQQKALCVKLNIDCFDLRSTSLRAVEKMKRAGKYKKERPYLTKNGFEWSKDGAAELGNALQRYLGVNKSGIGRKIKADDYVCFFLGFDYGLKKNIAQMEIEIKEPFADKPKSPRLKPIKLAAQFYNGDTDFPEVTSQKPTVAVVQLGLTVPTHSTLGVAKLPASYDVLMKTLLSQSKDVFIMTPPLPMETGTSKVDTNGKAYKKTQQVIEIINTSAKKHGIPVIDIFSLMEAHHKEHPDAFLYGRNNKQGIEMGAAYIRIVTQELRKVVGLPPSDNVYIHSANK